MDKPHEQCIKRSQEKCDCVSDYIKELQAKIKELKTDNTKQLNNYIRMAKGQLATIKALQKENAMIELWRELLWEHHGCTARELDGSNGKLMCNKCKIDFVTMSESQMQHRFEELKNTRRQTVG